MTSFIEQEYNRMKEKEYARANEAKKRDEAFSKASSKAINHFGKIGKLGAIQPQYLAKLIDEIQLEILHACAGDVADDVNAVVDRYSDFRNAWWELEKAKDSLK